MNPADQEWGDDDAGEYSSKSYVIDGGFVFCEILKDGDSWVCSASMQCDQEVRLDSKEIDLTEAKKQLESYIEEWFGFF